MEEDIERFSKVKTFLSIILTDDKMKHFTKCFYPSAEAIQNFVHEAKNRTTPFTPREADALQLTWPKENGMPSIIREK